VDYARTARSCLFGESIVGVSHSASAPRRISRLGSVSARRGRTGPAGSILWCSEPPGQLARSPLTRAASACCSRMGPAGFTLWLLHRRASWLGRR